MLLDRCQYLRAAQVKESPEVLVFVHDEKFRFGFVEKNFVLFAESHQVFVDFQSGIVVFLETFWNESILKHKLIEHSVDSILCDVGSADFDLPE